MRAIYTRVVLTGFVAVILANSSSHCFAQFGGFGGMGIPGFGGMGGPGNFNPTVTNSLNRTVTQPSLDNFAHDRPENSATQRAKYSDSLFARPLKPSGGSGGSGYAGLTGALATRRARERKPSAATGSSSADSRNPNRFPPGLRDVKKARRSSMTAGRQEPSGPDLQGASPGPR